jgi:hypothetical protein
MLESAGERGKDISLPNSASSCSTCLVTVLYFLAVEVATEALKSFSAKFLRCCGASCGRQDVDSFGPLGFVLNLLGWVGVGVVFLG